MNAVDELVALSHRYGEGYDWVIAGGGNTSVKDEHTMWVKSSGTTLASIAAEEFVAMDRAALAEIWNTVYPTEADEREQKALADLMAARAEGGSSGGADRRPSVETLMHALFPQRFVVHTHPTMLNGITCARRGEATVRELFGERALWVPTIDPGYTLARDMKNRIDQWLTDHNGAWPKIVIMQNHGLVVAADTIEEIDALHETVTATVRPAIDRFPEMTPEQRDTDPLREPAEAVARALAEMYAAHGSALEVPVVTAFTNPELQRRAASPEAMEPISSAFSPDHIVYSGHRPCYVNLPSGTNSPQVLQSEVLHAVHDYVHDENGPPKVVVIRGRGAVAVTPTERKTEIARLLFLNALQIAAYAESFGGSQFMPQDQIEFVRGWEVEKFREQHSTA
ncbi:MAG TPA: class II aldolase/adducin family protein [Alkalispirochaeta sp.]|nr:class II aldolase/adducin family protein [Alkalispirochaeta sp.]